MDINNTTVEDLNTIIATAKERKKKLSNVPWQTGDVIKESSTSLLLVTSNYAKTEFGFVQVGQGSYYPGQIICHAPSVEMLQSQWKYLKNLGNISKVLTKVK